MSQSSRPIGFLIGAGCPSALRDASANPLIPDIAGVTTRIDAIIKAGPRSVIWNSLIQTFVADGKASPNIEEILSRVRGFQEYAGAADVRGLTKAQLSEIEKDITREIRQLVEKDLPATDNPYISLATWLGNLSRSVPAEVFTTNYDLLIEQALERRKVPFYDGFVGAVRPFFDAPGLRNKTVPAGWIRLWKLHGSINWEKQVVSGQAEITRAGKPVNDALIHPSHLKYDESRKMPYLAMIDQLKEFLSRPSAVLVTSGFAFRDQHLNEVILESMRANPNAVTHGLVFGALAGYPEAQALAHAHPNFRLQAEDAAVVGGKDINWIERDSMPAAKLPGGAVEWQRISGPPDRFRPRFRMGDFAILGGVLDSVAKGIH